MEYLEFELPIKELHDQLDKCVLIGTESEVDVTETCAQIEKKLDKLERPYLDDFSWLTLELTQRSIYNSYCSIDIDSRCVSRELTR